MTPKSKTEVLVAKLGEAYRLEDADRPNDPLNQKICTGTYPAATNPVRRLQLVQALDNLDASLVPGVLPAKRKIILSPIIGNNITNVCGFTYAVGVKCQWNIAVNAGPFPPVFVPLANTTYTFQVKMGPGFWMLPGFPFGWDSTMTFSFTTGNTAPTKSVFIAAFVAQINSSLSLSPLFDYISITDNGPGTSIRLESKLVGSQYNFEVFLEASSGFGASNIDTTLTQDFVGKDEVGGYDMVHALEKQMTAYAQQNQIGQPEQFVLPTKALPGEKYAGICIRHWQPADMGVAAPGQHFITKWLFFQATVVSPGVLTTDYTYAVNAGVGTIRPITGTAEVGFQNYLQAINASFINDVANVPFE